MRELVEDYVARASRLVPTAVRELRASVAGDESRRKSEDMVAVRAAAAGATAVLLTERGAAWDSPRLAGFLGERIDRGAGPTVFLCGGEAGFHSEEEGWAAERVALSRFTMPHELARVVLSEQVYRALMHYRNRRYHR